MRRLLLLSGLLLLLTAAAVWAQQTGGSFYWAEEGAGAASISPTPAATPSPSPTPGGPTPQPSTTPGCPLPQPTPGPGQPTPCPAMHLFVGLGGTDVGNNCVNVNSPCQTVQHATDLCQTCGNCTVYVGSGSYPENVVITVPGRPPVCNLMAALGQQPAILQSLMPAPYWYIDRSICQLQSHVGNCPP